MNGSVKAHAFQYLQSCKESERIIAFSRRNAWWRWRCADVPRLIAEDTVRHSFSNENSHVTNHLTELLSCVKSNSLPVLHFLAFVLDFQATPTQMTI